MADQPTRISRPVPPAFDLRARRIPAGVGGPGQVYSGSNLQPPIDAEQQAALDAILTELTEQQIQRLLKAIERRGHLIMKPIVVGTAAINLLPQQSGRTYLLIINTSGVNNLFLGLDVMPQTTFGIPIAINFGFWEPLVVPDNEINVVGAGAGTTGVCVYATHTE